MSEKLLHRISVFSLCAVAWVLGLKKLIEPDIWWYLRTGEWILENGQAPTNDFLSFSHSGVEWLNVKWLYEVILYGFSTVGGPEFTSVFQSIINVLLVLVGFGIYKELTHKINIGTWSIVTLLALFICNFRMTARPETISHLFSLLMIYSYFLGKNKNRKFFFLWIPIQLLWTNLHEAYATGIVIITCFTLWELFIAFKAKLNLIKQPITLSLLASVAAVTINPRGFYMLIHPFEIFSQLSRNKFTSELLDYSTAEYWSHWESVSFIITLSIVVILLFISKGKPSLNRVKENFASATIPYLFVLVLFAYLGFSAQRNIPFFILASAPVIAYLVSGWFKQRLKVPTLIIAILLLWSSYAIIVTNTFYEFTDSRQTYGLEVSSFSNPIGLSEAVKQIDFKAVHFSDFLTSSYLLWDNKDYKSYIDLRDLDVFPEAFFQNLRLVTNDFGAFHRLDSLNDFKYLYLKRLNYMDMIRNLNSDAKWTLTYADPVACLFIKQPDTAEHRDIFKAPASMSNSAISDAILKICNPIYTHITPDVDLHKMATNFYDEIDENQLALNRISSAKNSNSDYDYLCMKGRVLSNLAFDQNNDSLMTEAWSYLGKAKQLAPKKGNAYVQSGVLLYRQGRTTDAITEFKISLKHQPDNFDVYLILAECQNALSQLDPANNALYSKNWLEYMESAYQYQSDNQMLAYQLGVTYCLNNLCEKALPYLNRTPDDLPFLTPEEKLQLKRCKKKCDS